MESAETPSFLCDPASVARLGSSLTMVILRGLPGSGKSTLARRIKELLPQAESCSADNYFTDAEGEYSFDKSQLSSAHSSCLETAELLCSSFTPVVVVDNTNVRKFEIYPYIHLAAKYRYSVVLVEPGTPWARDVEELARRNSHGVPADTIAKRAKEWQVVLPRYYAWLLHLSDSRLLLARASSWLETLHRASQPVRDLAGSLESLLARYRPASQVLHCTARFLGSRTKGQEELEHVKKCLGMAYNLSVVGFFFTPNTWGAKVSLGEEQEELWMEDMPEVRPDFSHLKKMQDKEGSLKKDPKNNEKVEKGVKYEESDLAGYEACQPSLVEGGSRVFSALGERAHITLGCVEGVRPVQCGLDLLELQASRLEGEPVVLEGGQLSQRGAQGFFLALDKPLTFSSIFTGSY